MQLKGGAGVEALRWVFAGFCFVLFGFSVVVLVFAALHYAEMRAAFDEVQSQRDYDFRADQMFTKFRPEAALGIYYLGLALGAVFMVISFIGFCGAACLDRCFLAVYSISLGVVVAATIAGLAVAINVYREDFEATAGHLYDEFVTHLYGRGDMMSNAFTKLIDHIQETRKCCGTLRYETDDETKEKYGASATYYTLLHWIESTQWGQMQANSIGYSENDKMMWVPESCCVQKGKKCALGQYGEHYEWNATKEQYWSSKIHKFGCGKYLLDIEGLTGGTGRTTIIAVAVTILVVIVATIVFALWMCQSITIYDADSHRSELDESRHRGRHRAHRPRRDMEEGRQTMEVVQETPVRSPKSPGNPISQKSKEPQPSATSQKSKSKSDSSPVKQRKTTLEAQNQKQTEETSKSQKIKSH